MNSLIKQDLQRMRRAAYFSTRGVKRLLQPGRKTGFTGKSRTITITRSTAPSNVALVAGDYSGYLDITLSSVQTSDLVLMWDQFKILSVTAHVTPVVDPGNSGVTNNSNIIAYLACDPQGKYTAPTTTQIGAFENRKIQTLVAGRELRFTYQPRAVNALATGSFASTTDWIFCNASGIAVPHQRLLINYQATNAADVQTVQIWLEYKIALKGIV
jgi:hypothetical protein